MVVVVDFALVRTSADTGVKPHPREGRRNAALSATGVSNETFDFEDLLRVGRDSGLGANCDDFVNATRLTCELSDEADPASIFAN